MKASLLTIYLLSFVVLVPISKSYCQEPEEKEIFQSSAFSSQPDTIKVGETSSKTKKYKNLFQSWGYTVLTDFSVAPFTIYPVSRDINSNGTPVIKYAIGERMAAVNFISYTYQIRYNIREFNSNASLSLSIPMTGGFGPAFSKRNVGIGTINIPLLLELNIGTGATNSSDKEHGILLGAGIEYCKFPIIIFGDEPDIKDMNGKDVPSFIDWFEPALELGYRFWDKNNRAKEINLKYGFGTSKAQVPEDANYTDGDFFLTSRTIKITLLYLINY